MKEMYKKSEGKRGKLFDNRQEESSTISDKNFLPCTSLSKLRHFPITSKETALVYSNYLK